jgi:predicted RNA-binding protein with EMAP domain
MARKPAKLQGLRYRYNKAMKLGKFNEAKKIDAYAKSVHGSSIDEEYHAKLEQKQDPKDPFGLGKTQKNRRIKYG